MPDEPSSSASEYHHHDGTPGSAADRSARTAVPDSFPASDPVATTPAVGVRAIAADEMMDAPGMPETPDAATVNARFKDHVTAKLAVEKLVRDVPLDRRSATLSDEGGGVNLAITASQSDMGRITEILRGGGGVVPAQGKMG